MEKFNLANLFIDNYILASKINELIDENEKLLEAIRLLKEIEKTKSVDTKATYQFGTYLHEHVYYGRDNFYSCALCGKIEKNGYQEAEESNKLEK